MKPVTKKTLMPSKNGTLKIFYDDLKDEAKSMVLDYFHMDDPEEGNFKIIPLFVLEFNNET